MSMQSPHNVAVWIAMVSILFGVLLLWGWGCGARFVLALSAWLAFDVSHLLFF